MENHILSDYDKRIATFGNSIDDTYKTKYAAAGFFLCDNKLMCYACGLILSPFELECYDAFVYHCAAYIHSCFKHWTLTQSVTNLFCPHVQKTLPKRLLYHYYISIASLVDILSCSNQQLCERVQIYPFIDGTRIFNDDLIVKPVSSLTLDEVETEILYLKSKIDSCTDFSTTCNICLTHSLNVYLGCKHAFCIYCLFKLLCKIYDDDTKIKVKPLCPYCRTNIQIVNSVFLNAENDDV